MKPIHNAAQGYHRADAPAAAWNPPSRSPDVYGDCQP